MVQGVNQIFACQHKFTKLLGILVRAQSHNVHDHPLLRPTLLSAVGELEPTAGDLADNSTITHTILPALLPADREADYVFHTRNKMKSV